ncbi:MAG: thioredoxin-dependent thiol peroxidase [Solirubrobacteraceae bacterium]
MLKATDPAPKFTLPDHEGEPVSLKDFRGQPVVVYFYPKASTPGCTVQACGVRDHRADYEAAGATVLAISRDPLPALKAFTDEHRLAGPGFRLLSDADHAVSEAYGVWVEKSMYGRKYMGIQRASFVINPKGKIAGVVEKANPKTHDDVVLGLLAEMGVRV